MSQNAVQDRGTQQINAPFRAKSAGVSLIVVLVVGIFYAVNALGLLTSEQPVPDGALTLVIATIVLIVVVEVALQIVLFIGAGRTEDRSARDDAIGAQASRNGYMLLTAGVFATFASMFAGFTPFEMGSVLVVAFVLAEAAKFGSQVWYYARSA